MGQVEAGLSIHFGLTPRSGLEARAGSRGSRRQSRGPSLELNLKGWTLMGPKVQRQAAALNCKMVLQ